MGCLLFKRPPNGGVGSSAPSKAAPGGDVLVTQTHCLADADAAALALWLRNTCRLGGLGTFYEKGLSSSPDLVGPQRRRLRDAFEGARCVAAAAVSSVLADAQAVPPLTRELLWAEQHGKPIVMLYDAARPFLRRRWEAEWPFLFEPKGLVVRYYGRGHEACQAELLKVLRQAMQGPKHAAARGSLSKEAAQPSAIAAPEAGAGPESPQGRQDRDDQPSASFDHAVAMLQAAQAASVPPLEPPALSSGILRQPGGASVSSERKRPARLGFQPTDENVQAAASSVVASLQMPGMGVEAVLGCLQAGLGISELVVSRSLRVLATLLSSELPHVVQNLAPSVADWALVTLRRHADSVDACTAALEVLVVAWHSLPPGWLSSSNAKAVATALKDYYNCQALQRHGFVLFAGSLGQQPVVEQGSVEPEAPGDEGTTIALRGGGVARVLARVGVAELALHALGRHYGDEALVASVFAVLQGLVASSREVKLLLAAPRACKVWAALLRHAHLGAVAAVATLRFLASLVTNDPPVQAAVGAIEDLFCVLDQRLFLGEDQEDGDRTEDREIPEVFNLLCRLTARSVENKRRCLGTGLPQQAVQLCLDSRMPEFARLAAGGLLVNLCSGGGGGRRRVLLAGAEDAAVALGSADGRLQECGQALGQLLAVCEQVPPAAPAAGAPGTRSVFDDLFAQRRQPGMEQAAAVPSNGPAGTGGTSPKGSSRKVRATGARNGRAARGDARQPVLEGRAAASSGSSTSGRETRGLGWHRPPKAFEAAATCAESDAESSAGSGTRDNHDGSLTLPAPPADADPWDGLVQGEDMLPWPGALKLADLELIPEPKQSPISPPPEFASPRPAMNDAPAGGTSGPAAGRSTVPVHGLKGTETMRSRLAELRLGKDQGVAEQGVAAQAKQPRSSLFGRSKRAAPPREWARPEERERKLHVARLALQASGPA